MSDADRKEDMDRVHLSIGCWNGHDSVGMPPARMPDRLWGKMFELQLSFLATQAAQLHLTAAVHSKDADRLAVAADELDAAMGDTLRLLREITEESLADREKFGRTANV